MQVQIFQTTDDFFEAMFGPPQHDRHVLRFRQYQKHIADMAWYAAAEDRLRASNEEFFKQVRARRQQ